MSENRETFPHAAQETVDPALTELSPEKLAIREALAAKEAREAEDRLYIQGRNDYCSKHRDTEAAKFYIDYWARQL